MKKKIVISVLAGTMILALTACSPSQQGGGHNHQDPQPTEEPSEPEEPTEPETPTEPEEPEVEETVVASVVKGMGLDTDADDNTKSVLNDNFAGYYKENDSLQGVEAIIAAGKCIVNGNAIPADAESFAAGGFTINDSSLMTDNGDGTYSVGARFNKKTYDNYAEAAANALVSAICNGNESLLYDEDGDGYADRIETLIYATVQANEITYNRKAGTVTISQGTFPDIDYPERYAKFVDSDDSRAFALGENVPEEYVADDIEVGDVLVYYKNGTDEYYTFEKATQVTGNLDYGADHSEYVMDGVTYPDAMNFPRNLLISNRGGGYSNWLQYFELNQEKYGSVSLWVTPVSEYAAEEGLSGAPIGLTSDMNAKKFLKEAIEQAEEALEENAESEDGSDVAEGTWVPTEYYEELKTCVDMAKDVLHAKTSNTFYDWASYMLYVTLEGTKNDISASYMGYDFEGFNNFISEYYTLYTVVDKEDMPLTDFAEYFAGDDVEAAIKEIVANGEVYVNNYRIPYVDADGNYTSTDYTINGEDALWQQEDGTWAWHIQKLYSYDMPLMANLEDGFHAGETVDFETASYLFTKYLSAMEGQTVKLLAKCGETSACRIETMCVDTAVISGTGGNYAQLTLLGVDGQPLTDAKGNVIYVENSNTDYDNGQTGLADIIMIWDDGSYGNGEWVVRKAQANHGTLIQTEDDHNPLWQPAGSEETQTISECIIGRSNISDAFKHTQFIRGYRRTNEYEMADDIIMWTLPEDSELGTIGGGCIGFTRDSSAAAALAHAITYAEETTADIVVSEDGTDVAVGTYWVTQDVMDAYTSVLAEAKAMSEAGTVSSLEMDTMLLDLANVLGGTEDLNSTGPMKMNPLGVIGSVAYGTMETEESAAEAEEAETPAAEAEEAETPAAEAEEAETPAAEAEEAETPAAEAEEEEIPVAEEAVVPEEKAEEAAEVSDSAENAEEGADEAEDAEAAML